MTFIDLLHGVYEIRFKEITYKLATRPANRIGSDEVWDKAEQALGRHSTVDRCRGRRKKARAPSTDPKSSLHCAIRLGALGNAVLCRWILDAWTSRRNLRR